jgi:formylglycine-generating enzyme required for sulfatase activity
MRMTVLDMSRWRRGRTLLIACTTALALGWWCLPRRGEPYFQSVVPRPGDRPAAPPGPDLPAPEGLESFINSLGMRMIRVPTGSFVQGSPDTERARRNNESMTSVTMPRAFWISQTEVTQAQFRALKVYDWSRFKGDLLPATNMSFWQAADFCRVLGEIEGRAYRLPGETEWEYACRAGTTTPFNTGEDLTAAQARFAGRAADADEPADAAGGPRPVGSYPPNVWGLHDMHGNVAEWMGNPYHPANRPLLTTDDQGYFIVSFDFPLRGGGWASRAADCRSARREHGHANVNGDAIGFRVVFEEPDHGSDE